MPFGLTKKTVKQLKDLFKKYPEISQVKIYGSRARGDYKRGSDIDLVFFSESTKELSLRLSWELKALNTLYLFDIVNYKTLSNNYLKKEIDKYGKVFYLRNSKNSISQKTRHSHLERESKTNQKEENKNVRSKK